jgi:ribosomal protein S18 acetylase RimI-like enzyme
MLFRKAKKEELPKVSSLYKSVIGSTGCAWNDNYPNEENIQNDFDSGCLYVLVEDTSVIGAVSVVPENELDHMNCWNIKDGKQRELARLVVSPYYQGKGYAREMLTRLFIELRDSGCPAVHILVAKGNDYAIRLYKSLGFSFLEECFMYGNDFYACEKAL